MNQKQEIVMVAKMDVHFPFPVSRDEGVRFFQFPEEKIIIETGEREFPDASNPMGTFSGDKIVETGMEQISFVENRAVIL